MSLKSKSLWTFIIATILITYSACRKTDQTPEPQNDNPKHSLIEDKFFNSNRTTDPTEKALVDFIKNKNNREHFVEQTVKQIGYPRWDKAITTKSNITAGRGNSDSSLATYYVPFVRDSQNFVNASMIISTNATDTTFSYKCDWQYAEMQNNNSLINDSAEHYAIFFMVLDKKVFGYNKFNITDTTLFNNGVNTPVFVTLDSTVSSGRNSLLEPIEFCQQVLITFQIPCTGKTATTTSNNRNNITFVCFGEIIYDYCWVEYIEVGGGGSGTGGSGSGGGGTSSGGGSTPPNCGGPTAGNRGQVNEGCTPGWEPIPIDDEPPYPLPPYIFNSLTKPCLKAALTKLSGGTSNTFFKQIYNTFDTSTILHLSINEGDLTADTAYGLVYSPVVLPSAGVSLEITMDTVTLINCSQEWMAYVLIHEVAHAAMFTNTIQWDTANSQHNAMAGQFLALMANSLMAAYPSLPEFDAYAMCFAGFFNGIEGSPSAEDKAISLLIAKKITQKFNVSYNDQQLADFGRQFTETGTKGLRNTCN